MLQVMWSSRTPVGIATGSLQHDLPHSRKHEVFDCDTEYIESLDKNKREI